MHFLLYHKCTMSNSISSSNHISTSCNYVSKEIVADTATNSSSCSTQLIKFEDTGLRLIDVDFLVGELTGAVNTSITEQKKKILFQTKICFVPGQKQRPVEVIHRIKDINFIAVRHHNPNPDAHYNPNPDTDTHHNPNPDAH